MNERMRHSPCMEAARPQRQHVEQFFARRKIVFRISRRVLSSALGEDRQAERVRLRDNEKHLMTAAEDRPPSPSRPKIVLAGIPWDENSSFLRGPSEAPPLIRAALFSEASELRSESGIDFPPEILVDAGDVPVRSGREMREEIGRFIGSAP